MVHFADLGNREVFIERKSQNTLENVTFAADYTRAPMQQALRNLPEGEVTAIGKSGRMTGKDIRLS